MYDVCIIGGGASGVIAAITAARRGKKVIIIEKNKKLCRKIYSTGNGKCNVTNKYFDFQNNYNSDSNNYPAFIKQVMGEKPNLKTIDLLKNLGITLYEDNNYYYPRSNQASAVVWAIQDEINKQKIQVELKTTVKEINKHNDMYEIVCDNSTHISKKIIFSCGGASYSSIGGSDIGYKLASSLGHSIIDISPALCGVHTKQNTESIAGVRIKSIATLVIKDKYIKENPQFAHLCEQGELQITTNGLSGIMIFNLASRINILLCNHIPFYLKLDLIPDITKEEYINCLKQSENRTIMGFINSLINDKMAQYILDNLNINPKEKLSDIDYDELNKIFNTLKALRFDLTKLNEIDSGQVCHGGVSIDEIDATTMASKIDKNIYFTGEMLDIDGMCGGYNLTFAFLSGERAGNNV